MILILSEPGDDTVRYVLPYLERRGVAVLWWDPATFPANSTATVHFSADGRRKLLRVDDDLHDLGEVTAVWERRPGKPVIPSEVTDPTHRQHAAWTCGDFVMGMIESLRARRLPGPRGAVQLADNKLVNLARAADLGFVVPETTVTNDPAELVPAWERARGRLIGKTALPYGFQLDGEDHGLFTSPIHRRHLAGRQRLRYEPMILQPNVDKAVELRVTVVGDRVFAAEIDSQASRTTSQDWRHYDDQTVRYATHDMPVAEQARCLELVRSFGLNYGALDFIVTPDGRYVFLEINPNGQWGWIEELTGLHIAEAIAEWLTADEGAS
ncbi:MvdC/MvdD family ATP grasp protein [Streptosporangium carneum]|uniref:ATP-grasp domain-containing protein n=1 Tax=Streptosporangium carneum TaxID=47481 RepID=A0A9W6I3X1_9ACTN|nr:ATP-dependent carboxylate-amine ligase [Streptosporangium carneum]GLK11612.1 hypothetical protein GCM10017600_50190 [Streptosporangium carneum]